MEPLGGGDAGLESLDGGLTGSGDITTNIDIAGMDKTDWLVTPMGQKKSVQNYSPSDGEMAENLDQENHARNNFNVEPPIDTAA